MQTFIVRAHVARFFQSTPFVFFEEVQGWVLNDHLNMFGTLPTLNQCLIHQGSDAAPSRFGLLSYRGLWRQTQIMHSHNRIEHTRCGSLHGRVDCTEKSSMVQPVRSMKFVLLYSCSTKFQRRLCSLSCAACRAPHS